MMKWNLKLKIVDNRSHFGGLAGIFGEIGRLEIVDSLAEW